jgi:proteasome component ECM29
MKDLLDNMFSSQWRTREATCYAIADLLVGKTADQVLPYLEQLWAKITLVIDDIKETVRKAAEQAFKVRSQSSCTCLVLTVQ